MTSAAISAAIVIAKTILEITQDLKQHSEVRKIEKKHKKIPI